MKKITKLGRKEEVGGGENKRLPSFSSQSRQQTSLLFFSPLLRSELACSEHCQEQQDPRKTDYGDSPKTLDYDLGVWP